MKVFLTVIYCIILHKHEKLTQRGFCFAGAPEEQSSPLSAVEAQNPWGFFYDFIICFVMLFYLTYNIILLILNFWCSFIFKLETLNRWLHQTDKQNYIKQNTERGKIFFFSSMLIIRGVCLYYAFWRHGEAADSY